MMKKPREWCVYWLYDDTCSQPSRDGYVGCCSRLDVRLRAHRKGAGTYKGAIGVPTDFKVAVLYLGPQNECLAYEELFRPTANIGWNRERGGKRSPYGHKHTNAFRKQKAADAKMRFTGVPKSIEQRAKMRTAALARYAKPGEKERTAKAVRKAFRDIDRSGTNNAMFGRHHSEETKQKIRDRIAERGGVSSKRNLNYRHGRYIE